MNHFISGNMLGDSARLAFGYICFSYVIKKGRLAVVYMAHYHYYRRPLYYSIFIIFIHLIILPYFTSALRKASFSSAVSSYSDLPPFTGLANMLILSRE